MSRYDPYFTKATRKIGRPNSPPSRTHQTRLTFSRRPLVLTKCDQEIVSPLCLNDETNQSAVNFKENEPDITNCSESSSETAAVSSRSIATQNQSNPNGASQGQSNTNYMPGQCHCGCNDPSRIDKCTELEAMRQGLARIQSGHGRPSDFLPANQHSSVDPYIQRSLDDIRRSIQEISHDNALQQEVKELKKSVKGLTKSPTMCSNRGSQLAGLIKDIRNSVAEPSQPSQNSAMMSTLLEIRGGIQQLIKAIEAVQVESKPGAIEKSNKSPIMGALEDIQQSLHMLLGIEPEIQGQIEGIEDNTIMNAIHDIRTSIRQLEASAEDEEQRRQAGELVDALTEIRQSVKVMATQSDKENNDNKQHTGAGADDACEAKANDAVTKVTNTIARSFEELQKTIECLSEKVICEKPKEVPLNAENKFKKCPKKKKKRRKGSKCRCRTESEDEDDEMDDDNGDNDDDEDDRAKFARCIKECCKDSCKIGKTCDKIIDFLITKEKKNQEPSGGCPQIQLLMQNQPPRFLAPIFRPPPRSLPPMQQPVALPPPPPPPLPAPPPPLPPTSPPPSVPPPPPPSAASNLPPQMPVTICYPIVPICTPMSPSQCQPPSQMASGRNCCQSVNNSRYQYQQPPCFPSQPPQMGRGAASSIPNPPPAPLNGIAVAQMNSMQSQMSSVTCSDTSQDTSERPILYRATASDDQAAPKAFTLSFVASADDDDCCGEKRGSKSRRFLCTPMDR